MKVKHRQFVIPPKHRHKDLPEDATTPLCYPWEDVGGTIVYSWKHVTCPECLARRKRG